MQPSRPATAPATASGNDAPPRPSLEARQRWRLTFRRRSDAPAVPQRDQVAAWEAGLVASGLPLFGLDLPVGRPKLVFGAPLPVGMEANGELLDFLLVERLPVADVRTALRPHLPAGHELVEIRDVWLGEPPLSGQVVAADYTVTLADDTWSPEKAVALRDAITRLLAAVSLPRTRDKGGRAVAYDLRPLLADVAIVTVESPVGAPVLRMRTRFDPERGVGRPEEVVAALADLVGRPLEVGGILRDRLVTSDIVDAHM